VKPRTGRIVPKSGSAILELQLVLLTLLLTVFAVFEIGRLCLVYTTVANAARIGVRYAIVHGSTNSGSGINGPSGPGNTANVEQVVTDYTAGSTLDPSLLTINVLYPSGGAQPNAPGSPVRVEVSYPYNPFIALPLSLTISTRTEGVITF
jgi:Flp pilus assembly protein TadG